MSGDKVYLTKDGYEKLTKELKFIKGVRRRELSKEIGEARAHGDLSENAEYEAAKEAQGLNEKRINELETKLARAEIIDELNIDTDKIYLGAKVKLKDLNNGEELERMLVPAEEMDYDDESKISITSPVAKGLLGHKVNDTVEVKVPAGTLRYKVLSITR